MKYLSLFLSFVFFFSSPVCAADVAVKKYRDGWRLLVDGQRFVVKGVGCNVAEGAQHEDYLRMAKDMGANTVRTWGVTPRAYFDKAHQYGLMVNAGVWFDPVRGGANESYTNPAYCRRLKQETLAHVRALKDHPALLTWNLGNEVFAFTEDEKEKKAFGLFLESLIKAVHKEDPHHPVVYACSGKADLPQLKAFVPSLDIVGINAYGTYSYILQWFKTNRYDKPLVLTEYGPFGEWDRMKDPNDQPYDPYDQNKAGNYADLWHEVERTAGRALGGFAFVLGDQRNQASMTWYNVNLGEKKRQAYWTLYTLYTGVEPPNRSPKIRLFQVEKVQALRPGENISVSVEGSDPDGDEVAFRYFFTDIAGDPLIVEPPHVFEAQVQVTGPGTAKIRAPGNSGLYRLYVVADDGKGNIAVANRSIEVGRL